MSAEVHFSTDKGQLDVEFIHQYLTTSYWAKGRSLETVKASIQNSLCIGVYKDSRQIGFARVVTDYAVFAWIMDVFINEEFQNQGLGKQLMTYLMGHTKLGKVRRWGLNTADAHKLYEKFGFKSLDSPEIYMEIKNTTT